MGLISKKPTSSGSRHQIKNTFDELSQGNKPLKSLLKPKTVTSGRNNAGRITVRHRGGGHKRRLRTIDFKRSKYDIPAKVKTIEYDPNRSANIALVTYNDGEKRYILAPAGLKIGDTILNSQTAEPKLGNSLPLKNIPIGMPIHNIELRPGKGGQLVRGAGTAALIQSKEGKYATIQLPSKELRLINIESFATIGQLGNVDKKNIKLGKAGSKRHLGFRPSVRGVAMHPGAHPHGGGEGRSGIGMPSPKSPWGKKTLGKKTRKKKKYSDKYIVRGRKRR